MCSSLTLAQLKGKLVKKKLHLKVILLFVTYINFQYSLVALILFPFLSFIDLEYLFSKGINFFNTHVKAIDCIVETPF